MLKPIIGLEIHIELSTASKMFCGCSAQHFSKKPNTQVCPICLGLPGALPFANQEAVERTVKLGLALDCQIAGFSKFDRKHYFYPDLPKGYQISQYDKPLCLGGKFQTAKSQTQIRIRRVHLEEDTGKLVHTEQDGEKVSLIDFNRSGVPLVGMVTEPDFKSVEEVVDFLKEIQTLARYLEISDCDMEKGSMRLEANISLSADGSLPDYKVELKNINSFRFLQKALESEVERQRSLLEAGQRVVQETRGYNEKTGKTFLQRTKEEEQDYRYFPEPDIAPLSLMQSEVAEIKKQIPELPAVKRARFSREYSLPENYIEILASEHSRAEYFEKALELGKTANLSAKTIADVIVNQKLDREFPEPGLLIKKLLEVTQKEFASQSEIEAAAESVLKENAKGVADYQKGKGEVIGFLIGQVQKILQGKGDPQAIRDVLLSNLNAKARKA
jgi:aspartyl-tRNA(Asn)/glutamyl-tRNA(Gln) amidotransferase subunit B